MSTPRQDRPAFRPLPELEHLADPNYSKLRKDHQPPTAAQTLARKRGSLLMKLGGVEAQLGIIKGEAARLGTNLDTTSMIQSFETMRDLLHSYNNQLRKSWNYKPLITFEESMKALEELEDDFF